MSRRTSSLVLCDDYGLRDGTSQAARHMTALDPAFEPIDGRSDGDMLRFVQAYAQQLRFFSVDSTGALDGDATWAGFVERASADVSIEDMVAYLEDPQRFSGDRARWLGRPHFALLLAFVRLLGHARDHLNGFTRRHLDYYYRERLQMVPESPVADRVTVVFSLRPGMSDVQLPEGTALQAGADSDGVERIYRTERDIVVNRGQIAELRSVHVDRQVTGISDVRRDRNRPAPDVLMAMLRLSLGSPHPGDAIPALGGDESLDFAQLRSLRPTVAATGTTLFLAHHERRALMRLARQRRGRSADREWVEIHQAMGLAEPPPPVHDQVSLNASVRTRLVDLGLPAQSDEDDLYARRAEPSVREFIAATLPGLGSDERGPYEAFVALMQEKVRINAEWDEVDRLLERAGQRQRGVVSWSRPPGGPSDFEARLERAYEGRWPLQLPQADDIETYEDLIQAYERHFSMLAERLQLLTEFADQVAENPVVGAHDWAAIDRVLADAHAERLYANRRAQVAEVRGGDEDVVAFDATAAFVLGHASPGVLSWPDARVRLTPHIDRSQLDQLDRFRLGLAEGRPPTGLTWAMVDRTFEVAWRGVQELPPPVAEQVDVRNVYAFDDPTAIRQTPAASGWMPFGRRPTNPGPAHECGATLGWAIRSSSLALVGGERRLKVTFGFQVDGFDTDALWSAFGVEPGVTAGEAFVRGVRSALRIEVSTSDGWCEPTITAARLAPAATGYFDLLGRESAGGTARPGLQVSLSVGADAAPLAATTPMSEPTLRFTLRPHWDEEVEAWRSPIGAFDPLMLAVVHVGVEVSGLKALRLQQEDRPLDPKKPFEPFGAQPAVGARLYFGHPELCRVRLDALRLDVEWMGLPKPNFAEHYRNYPELTDSGVFKGRMGFVDRSVERPIVEDAALFQDREGTTQPTQIFAVENVAQAVADHSQGFVYEGRSDVDLPDDLRDASRYLYLELSPQGFGHDRFGPLAASLSRNLAVDLAAGPASEVDPEDYRVNPPYTPKVKRMTATYASSFEIDAEAPPGEHRLLHVHPFGDCPIDGQRLLPRYDDAGALYIGVRDLSLPQNLTLLFQLAEGTSDADAEPVPLTWSFLDGERFVPLSSTQVLSDTTRGLINSGIVELALPAATPGGCMPVGQHWLRVSIPRAPQGVCDVVAIHTQAVSARFDDRGNAPGHYAQPLPAASIQGLVEPVAGISKVEQPYSASGGRPSESLQRLDTRTSERLRHKQRALAPWDFERLVLHHFSGIYKAKCLPGGEGRVDVVVIPDIRSVSPREILAPRAPAYLLSEIRDYLTARAPATAIIRARNPHYVSVRVRLGLRFRDGVDAGAAQRRLNDELVRFLSPWAFDDGAEVVIGGRIYANSIVDFADRQPDVDFVAAVTLFRSEDGVDFAPVPWTAEDYHVAAERPDQVLVAAPDHIFDVISDSSVDIDSFTGINFMRIELDCIVG